MKEFEIVQALTRQAEDGLIPLAHYLHKNQVKEFRILLMGGSFEWFPYEEEEEDGSRTEGGKAPQS
jgi:hypothetical protein